MINGDKISRRIAGAESIKEAMIKQVTIHDVAQAAGVTAATVSRTLSGKRQGTAPVREAVFRAVEELGYRPNPHAQRLAAGRSEKHIDLLSVHLDFGMDARKAQLIQGLLLARGFNAPLHAYGWGANENFEQHQLLSQLCRARPRAIVCDLSGLNGQSIQELQGFQAQGGVVVCWGYGETPHDIAGAQVLFNAQHSLKIAIQHLSELGHTRIGAAFPTRSFANHNRPRQFTQAMEKLGQVARQEWIFAGVPRLAHTEVEEAGQHVAEWFLGLENRPSALIIPNDYAALRFVNELHHAGLSVPGDVSVVAHDNRPLARSAPVPLSSITHPADQIAGGVVELLEAALSGEAGEMRHIVIQGELHARASSAAPLDLD